METGKDMPAAGAMGLKVTLDGFNRGGYRTHGEKSRGVKPDLKLNLLI
jgi:hypothetical protein